MTPADDIYGRAMGTYIDYILKEFKAVDINRDFVIDEREAASVKNPADPRQADANGDKTVTIEEYLNAKDRFAAYLIPKIFSQGWIENNPRWDKLTISDPYDRLSVALTALGNGGDELEKYLKKVKDGGRIILCSCSTGQKLADRIREWCDRTGKKIEVIAPPTDVGSELIIDDDGKINVKYSSPNGSSIEPSRFLSTGSSKGEYSQTTNDTAK